MTHGNGHPEAFPVPATGYAPGKRGEWLAKFLIEHGIRRQRGCGANYFEVPQSLIPKIAEMDCGEIRVYLILASHANAEGKCWPCVERVASLAGVSVRWVQRALVALEGRGLVRRQVRKTNRGSTSNVYTITPHEPGDVHATPPQLEDEVHATPGVNCTPPRTRAKRTRAKKGEARPLFSSQTREQSSRDAPTVEALVDQWNAIPGIVRCLKVTESRKRAYHTRAADPDWLANVPAALAKLAASTFCRGENDRGWRADIEWFLRPDTLVKLLEGKYDGKGRINGEPQPRKLRYVTAAPEAKS